MRFTTLTRMADNLMIYKYVVKNTATKWRRDVHAQTAVRDNASECTFIRVCGRARLICSTARRTPAGRAGRYYIGSC
jgi:glutamine synthetase